MNNYTAIGRLTRDPEIRELDGGRKVARYTLAVDTYRNANGENVAAFIPCEVWNQRAAFAEKYLTKGMKIAITGSLRSDSYEDANKQRKTRLYVSVDSQEFVESRGNGNGGAQKPAAAAPKAEEPDFGDDFAGGYEMPSFDDDDLPFA